MISLSISQRPVFCKVPFTITKWCISEVGKLKTLLPNEHHYVVSYASFYQSSIHFMKSFNYEIATHVVTIRFSPLEVWNNPNVSTTRRSWIDHQNLSVIWNSACIYVGEILVETFGFIPANKHISRNIEKRGLFSLRHLYMLFLYTGYNGWRVIASWAPISSSLLMCAIIPEEKSHRFVVNVLL